MYQKHVTQLKQIRKLKDVSYRRESVSDNIVIKRLKRRGRAERELESENVVRSKRENVQK